MSLAVFVFSSKNVGNGLKVSQNRLLQCVVFFQPPAVRLNDNLVFMKRFLVSFSRSSKF